MDNNNILQKLEGLESRYEEVSTLITDPDVIADQPRYVKLTKEWKDLGDIMDARKRYINCLNSIKEAKDILANESDPEMKEMAREELNENEALQPKLEEEIKIALVPKDPEDAKNVQMEIRGGAGGDEAALFAGDLFNMYKKYCESKGWNVSVTSVSEGAVGGYKEIDFAVSGTDVYGTLKYASHLLHFRIALVGKDILCLFDAVQAVDVSLACVHDITQVFPFLGEFHVACLVGDDIRVGNEGAYFLVSAL